MLDIADKTPARLPDNDRQVRQPRRLAQHSHHRRVRKACAAPCYRRDRPVRAMENVPDRQGRAGSGAEPRSHPVRADTER